MTYNTRSERHQKIQRKYTLNRKAVLPLLGTGLVLAPTTMAMVPQQVEAQEYVTENGAQGLINQIGATAQQIAANNDLYASVMIAQALLESGNGTSLLSSAPHYNLFGIKAYGSEPSIWLGTQEYINGQWVSMNEPFRVYGSYWESLQDHAALLRSTSYSTGVSNYSGTWKSQTTSFYDATAYLTGRYATDPTYNQKLNWLIETYNLTSFDTPSQVVTTYVEPEQTSYATETATAETGYTETAYTEPAYASSGTHTVVAGDTLWDIANTYGTSVDQLMANNGLTDGLIVAGQQLII